MNFTDDTSLTVKTTGNLLYFSDVVYVMEQKIEGDTLWESLLYEEVMVSETGLPQSPDFLSGSETIK